MRHALSWLAHHHERYANRWDPLAALGTLILVSLLYALMTLFPIFPRGWLGFALALGAILLNGLILGGGRN